MLTNEVSIKQFHAVFSVFMLFVSAFLFSVFLWCSYIGIDIIVSLDVFLSPIYTYSLSLTLTPYSVVFSSLVSLITGIVFIYSYSYIGFYSNYNFFLFTTFGFVLSMLVVINFSDLFIVILGWDGLGVISFFLIVYYNSIGTVYSGIFTMLINRVGDALLVVAISMLCLSSPLFTTFHTFSTSSLTVIFVLILGLITKSALFPFSPWLPAAMSAPTPISSLVHSSTLVTAGLYLMVRYSSFLYSSPYVTLLLIVTSIFTTFYAGLNSLVETDLKKLIALSTLSHLGFIGLAVSSGYEGLALFHLFTHALFKSLIFMSLGEVIGSQSHYQDTRFLSSGVSLTPESSSFIYISTLSLFGLPFVSGFYSNDIVLESLHFSGIAGTLLVAIVYVNLMFTYSYTSRVLVFCINTVQNTPYFNLSHPSAHSKHLIFLGVLSVVFGALYLQVTIVSYPIPVVPLARYLPLILLVTIVSIFVFNINRPSSSRPLVASALGSMLFLSEVNSNFFSTNSFALINVLTNTVEHGALSYFSIDMPRLSVVSMSRFVWIFLNSPIYSIMFVTLLVLIAYAVF